MVSSGIAGMAIAKNTVIRDNDHQSRGSVKPVAHLLKHLITPKNVRIEKIGQRPMPV